MSPSSKVSRVSRTHSYDVLVKIFHCYETRLCGISILWLSEAFFRIGKSKLDWHRSYFRSCSGRFVHKRKHKGKRNPDDLIPYQFNFLRVPSHSGWLSSQGFPFRPVCLPQAGGVDSNVKALRFFTRLHFALRPNRNLTDCSFCNAVGSQER